MINLKTAIQHLLGTKILKPTDDDSAKYHDNFVESGIEKARHILDDISKRWKNADLSKCAYFSIGGSTGAEIVYIMENSPIKYGLLLEYDSDATDIARKQEEKLSASGKRLKIITGDATQQISHCKETLLRWRDDEKKITGLIASAQAVLHELPFRSPGFHLGNFIGETAWDWDPFLFYSREPCAPSDWPDEVEISIPGVESNLLKELAEDVRAKLGMEGIVRTVGPICVSMPAKLAVETLTKIFYLDSYHHEIQEQVTSTDPTKLRTVLEKQLGKNSTSLQRLNSDSFEKKYREFGITAENSDGGPLSMPLAFAWIVGERQSPSAEKIKTENKPSSHADSHPVDDVQSGPDAPATSLKPANVVPSDQPQDSGIKIFICCADEDDEIARRLYGDFKKLGLTPWLASTDIRLGLNPDQAFRSEMEQSDYVVALLSRHSLTVRGFAQKQLRKALDIFDEFPPESIFLIPVQLDDTKPQDEKLRNLKSAELYKSYEQGFKEIIRAITPDKIDQISDSNLTQTITTSFSDAWATDTRPLENPGQPSKPDSDQQQIDLKNKLDEIERFFIQARYDQAYNQFYELCKPYAAYNSQAATILTRHNNLQNRIMSGTVPGHEQDTLNMQIASSFQMCLKKFKQEYSD